jgi:hypothetical protein
VEYTLEVIDSAAPAKYVRARREFSYDLENLTDQPKPFPFVAAIDQAPISELNREVRFIKLKVEDCEQPFELDEAKLIELQSEKELEKCLDLGQRIIVLPETTTKVALISQTVKHLQGGSLLLILANHTCDMELRVRVPKRDIEVLASAYADKVLKKTKTHDPDLGIFHWNTEKPILAYQGVYITWAPKDSQKEGVPNESNQGVAATKKIR